MAIFCISFKPVPFIQQYMKVLCRLLKRTIYFIVAERIKLAKI